MKVTLPGHSTGHFGEGETGSNTNRTSLDYHLQQSPTVQSSGSYSNSVDGVNSILSHHGFGLSDRSHGHIVGNISRVDSGQMTHAGASASEARAFAHDLFDSGLSTRDRAAAAVGVVLNGAFSPAYHAQHDIGAYHSGGNQSPEVRTQMHLFTQFDPHS